MEALRDLADDFNVRDPRKLYRLARQRDLDVTQAMAFEALKANVGAGAGAPAARAGQVGRRGAERPRAPDLGLLTGLPGTGKTHLARTIGERCTWCPRRTAPRRTWAWGRRRPTTGCAGTCAGQRAKADWLVVEEITQLWADLHALRLRHLQLCKVAAGRRGGVPHAGAGQGEAEEALPLQARVAGHHAAHQPQQAHGRSSKERQLIVT